MRVYLVLRSNGYGNEALKCFKQYENALAYKKQCKDNDVMADFWIDTFNIQDMEYV